MSNMFAEDAHNPEDGDDSNVDLVHEGGGNTDKTAIW